MKRSEDLRKEAMERTAYLIGVSMGDVNPVLLAEAFMIGYRTAEDFYRTLLKNALCAEPELAERNAH